MAEIEDLIVTDASNTDRWPENMAPSAVNNAARADEGILARWYRDTNGTLAAALSNSGSFTTTLNRVDNSGAFTLSDGLVLAVDFAAATTGPATLKITALGGSAKAAKPIVKSDGTALFAGDITANMKGLMYYDGASFQLLNPTGVMLDASGVLALPGEVTATGFTGTLDGVLGSGSASAATVTALEVTSLSGTGAVAITDILDEDNMASNSATKLSTQQSIKAYVDAQVTASDLDFAGGTGTGAVDLDSQTFTVAGTANEIETAASGQTITVGLPANVTIAGVTTHGGDVVSDTDSTDSLGTTGVRWAGTWTDAINGVTAPTAQYTSAEETKLAGIETAADVTDSTNVAAALANGVAALTSGEVTQLANIGTAAISAAEWGYVAASTQAYDAADHSKLNGIEALADVTDATNVLAGLVGQEAVATGFTGTLDGVLGGGTPAAATVTTLEATNLQGAAIGINADDVPKNWMLGSAAYVDTDEIVKAVGRKNLIINGDMMISQRGTSWAAFTTDTYNLDRWYGRHAGAGVVTISQSTDVPTGKGFKYSLKYLATTLDASMAAGDHYAIGTRIEGYDIAQTEVGSTDAKNVTLSFWVKSSTLGKYGVGLVNGSNNRSIAVPYEINAIDTWEFKELLIGLDTNATGWLFTNGIGLTINWGIAVGTTFTDVEDTWGTTANVMSVDGNVNGVENTNDAFFLTGVQLEVGSNATPFEHRPYQQELALCQRYYQKTYIDGIYPGATSPYSQLMAVSVGTTTATTSITWAFTVPMRASPTVVAYSTIGGATGNFRRNGGAADVAVVVYNTGNRSVNFYNNAATTAGDLLFGHATSSAEL